MADATLDSTQTKLLHQLVKYLLATEFDGYNDTKEKHGDKVARQHIYAKAQTLNQLFKE